MTNSNSNLKLRLLNLQQWMVTPFCCFLYTNILAGLNTTIDFAFKHTMLLTFELRWWHSSLICLFFSAMHFATYLTGLSSLMLIWAAGARCKWRVPLHNRMPWQRLKPRTSGQALYHWAILTRACVAIAF